MIQAKFEKKRFHLTGFDNYTGPQLFKLTVNMAGWQKKTKKIYECFIFNYSK